MPTLAWRIDNRDAVFSKLRLWRDANHNGISEADELHPLSDFGIESISLDYKESRHKDRFGNEFRYRAKIYGANHGELGPLGIRRLPVEREVTFFGVNQTREHPQAQSSFRVCCYSNALPNGRATTTRPSSQVGLPFHYLISHPDLPRRERGIVPRRTHTTICASYYSARQ